MKSLEEPQGHFLLLFWPTVYHLNRERSSLTLHSRFHKALQGFQQMLETEEAGQRKSHLCYSGLLLLELAESEDASSRLIVELLLEGVEQLHLLAKTGHTCGHNVTPSSGCLFMWTTCSSGLSLLHRLTCTQTPVRPPAESER